MSVEPATPVPHHRVVVVGSGFSGLGLAIRLRQAGMTSTDDFVVLERADDLGGTWRDNRYPGATCDVPSHLYSFSFAPNPDWTRSFSPQPEIWAYLERCAREYGVRPHLRFGSELLGADWDAGRRLWRLRTAGGEMTAQVLVSATGALSDPAIPSIPGLDDFSGAVFHSASWDASHDFSGRRVAVVGTGASAIQFVPRIAPQVDRLHLFQRTPPWVLPRRDRALTAVERGAFRRVPALQRLARAGIYWAREALVLGLTRHRRLMRGAEALGRRHLRRQVPDPALRRRLTPDYTIGCKRILISDDYYPALGRDNVEVVTDGIREVRPHGVVTADGTEREVDTIVFGTGFRPTDMPVASRVRGADGRSLADVWGGSPEAYLGTSVAGFPNLFMLIGPNTGLGHSSMVLMIESQVTYVLDALRHLQRDDLDAVDVRPEVQRTYNARLQDDMRDTVWTAGGCASWYLDAAGRNTTLWPSFTWRFRAATRRFDPSDYRLVPAGPRSPSRPEPPERVEPAPSRGGSS